MNVYDTMFSIINVDLSIRALLLDHILALPKNTRTPHMHLVYVYYAMCMVSLVTTF